MTRGLFLDFDGVAHPVSDIEDWRELGVSSADLPALVEQRQLLRWLPLLEAALEPHPDVLIVVHSGWRSKADNVQMRKYLGGMAERFVGVTSMELPRYEGILQLAERAGFDEYLIIDDAKHEFPAGLPQLLATHPQRGLQDAEIGEALRSWLEKTAPAPAPSEAARSMAG